MTTTMVQGAMGVGTVETAGAAAGSAAPFSDLLQNMATQVQGLEKDAASKAAGVLDGTGTDIHQAMIAAQKVDLAFRLAIEVRNKAVQAYQQVMQMQF